MRPPAPWRPSKLRFEVEAQRSPGARMSGFMPRHIEQPASRHSKPGGREDAVEALLLGLLLDLGRAGDDHRAHRRGDRVAVDDLGRGAEVLDARVRARADEDAVDGDLRERGSGLEIHVAQRALDGLAVGGVGVLGGIGNAAVDRRDHPGVRAPGHLRHERGDVDLDLAVEDRVRRRSRARATRRAPAPSRRPSARPGDPRGRRTSCRRDRPSRRGRRPRSTCCRPSSGPPSRAPRSPAPRTRARSRRRRRRRSARSRPAPCPSR